MRQHFSIRVGGKLVAAFALELFAQYRVSFDHAIVHERDFSALVEMRMRIFVGYFSVGGPTSVADAVLARGRFFGHQLGKVRDSSGAFARLHLPPIYDRDAGGIVTAIFERRRPSRRMGAASARPTYPTIPHIILRGGL